MKGKLEIEFNPCNLGDVPTIKAWVESPQGETPLHLTMELCTEMVVVGRHVQAYVNGCLQVVEVAGYPTQAKE